MRSTRHAQDERFRWFGWRRGELALIVAALAAVAAACGSEPTSLEGVDLPVAATPALVEEGTWAVAFTAEIPSGFWEGGDHRYRMLLDCPILGAEFETSAINFRSTELTLIQPRDVYLRAGGLSEDILLPPLPGSIHPGQATVAAITVMGNTLANSNEALDLCEGSFEYDGGNTLPLTPIEPFQP